MSTSCLPSGRWGPFPAEPGWQSEGGASPLPHANPCRSSGLVRPVLFWQDWEWDVISSRSYRISQQNQENQEGGTLIFPLPFSFQHGILWIWKGVKVIDLLAMLLAALIIKPGQRSSISTNQAFLFLGCVHIPTCLGFSFSCDYG